jgi:hypothetical protein
MLQTAIELPIEAIRNLCQLYSIRKLSLFGSILSDQFDADSDVDMLVEFEPGADIGYFELATIEAELARLLGSRRVDVREPEELSRSFRQDVLNSAVVLYERT